MQPVINLSPFDCKSSSLCTSGPFWKAWDMVFKGYSLLCKHLEFLSNFWKWSGSVQFSLTRETVRLVCHVWYAADESSQSLGGCRHGLRNQPVVLNAEGPHFELHWKMWDWFWNSCSGPWWNLHSSLDLLMTSSCEQEQHQCETFSWNVGPGYMYSSSHQPRNRLV